MWRCVCVYVCICGYIGLLRWLLIRVVVELLNCVFVGLLICCVVYLLGC